LQQQLALAKYYEQHTLQFGPLELLAKVQNPYLTHFHCHERYPQQLDDGEHWVCAHCNAYLAGVDGGRGLCLHKCSKPVVYTPEETGVCGLCSKFMGRGKPHTCNSVVITHVLFDFTAVNGCAAAAHVDQKELQDFQALIRKATIPFYMVLPEGRCWPGYLALSTLEGIGQGLFTSIPLGCSSAQLPERLSFSIGDMLMVYSGEYVQGDAEMQARYEQQRDAVPGVPSLALYTIIQGSGKRSRKVAVIDPSVWGGLAVMANSHHKQQNMAAQDRRCRGSQKWQMYLVLLQCVAKHGEVFWEYSATSDNPEDWKVLCRCCNLPFFRPSDGIVAMETGKSV
jgi:hypothetical protein